MRSLFAILMCTLVALSLVAHFTTPEPFDGLTWATDCYPNEAAMQMELFRDRTGVAMRNDFNNRELTKVLVQSSAGMGPDVFDYMYFDKPQLYSAVSAGIALDVTEQAKRLGFGIDKIWPKVREAVTLDGRQYGFPCNVNADATFYNKDLLDKHCRDLLEKYYGGKYPSGHIAWPRFIEFAKRMTVRRTGGPGYECFGLAEIDWRMCVWQQGGSIYSEDGTRCVLDSPEAVRGLEFLHDLYFKHKIMPTPSQQRAMSGEGGWVTGAYRQFGQNRYGFFFCGRWILLIYRSQYPKLRWGVCHQPHPPGRRLVIPCGARCAAVNSKSPRRKEALQFLAFLASKEYARTIIDTADALPGTKDYCPPEALDDPRFPAERGYGRIFIEAMDYAHAPEVSPFINPWVSSRITKRQIDLLSNGEKPPRDAARQMAAEVNAEIQRTIGRDPSLRAEYQRRVAASEGAARGAK